MSVSVSKIEVSFLKNMWTWDLLTLSSIELLKRKISFLSREPSLILLMYSLNRSKSSSSIRVLSLSSLSSGRSSSLFSSSISSCFSSSAVGPFYSSFGALSGSPPSMFAAFPFFHFCKSFSAWNHITLPFSSISLTMKSPNRCLITHEMEMLS